MSKHTEKIKNPNIRLHNEIIEFYEFIRPKEKEHNRRLIAFKELKEFFEEEIPNSTLLPFGSFTTKLYLPGSDIDLVLLNQRVNVKSLIKKTRKLFQKFSGSFSNVDVLKNAKVPIIKFTHNNSGIEFDITFNEQMGLDNITEVKKSIKIHPEIKYLLLLMKLFLRQRRFNITFNGGIGSFLLFNLILAFLRLYKKEIIGKNKNINSLRDVTLSEYFMKFLHFYSRFDIVQSEIHMVNGGGIGRKKDSNMEFCLYSPIEPRVNIGGKAFRVREIFNTFKNRLNLTTNKNYDKQRSILKDFINPSNKDFSDYLNDCN